MNQEKINRNLAERDSTSSEFQQKVVATARAWMKASSERMSTFHQRWDENSYLYRGYRIVDKEDKEAMREGLPPKLVVPVSYAQLQTAVSFIMSMYLQKDNVLELTGTGPEDVTPAMALTSDLSYQLQRDAFEMKLYFWLVDAWKQGFGVVRVEWDEEYVPMRVARQESQFSLPGLLGMAFGKALPTKTVEAVEEVLSYQGNKIRNVSPYAFYPDPSVNICNFQEGKFVGMEEEVAINTITGREGEVYFGTDKIPNSIDKGMFNERPRRVTGPFGNQDTADKGTGLITPKEDKARSCIRLELECCLSEKEASKLWEANLGNGDRPVKWLITIINDQKLVRFERKANLHNRFSFELFEHSPDHDAFYNPGMVEIVSELQDLITFFLNSHVANIRKIIANRFVVDPTRVDMDDIKNGNIYIKTKGAGVDVSRVIKQLDTSDITRANVTDMANLDDIVKVVTGVSDNALGQYSPGRRSATEARNVNAGSASRLKLHAMLHWAQGLRPFGLQLLSNTRQWRTQEVYAEIVGAMIQDAPFETTILADPKRLAGGYDFVPFDGTLPSERERHAMVLTELFDLLVSNPQSMQLVNKNPMKLLEHIAKLYNIRNLREFDLSALPPPVVPPGAGVPQPKVVSNQEAGEAAASGAEPVDMTGEDVLRGLAQ